MWKKVLLSVMLVAFFAMGVEVLISQKNKKQTIENNDSNIVKSETEISKEEYVTDDCIEEWKDYAKYVEDELREVNLNVAEENKLYIIRAKDSKVNIYYINEKEEEILYRATDISTEYLSKEDVENLEKGIQVQGIENLNQMLEDFE